jgi:aerobic carbon-monoxide dehydrogenase medium subunit
MKAAPFELHRPATLEEALQLLSEVAPAEGRVIAGGQTLVPAMALRLARPSHLVDINSVPGFDRLIVEPNALTISACVRHAAFHKPVIDGPLGALLTRVVRHIAHLPVRSRGTFCGSLANADAASEWCLVATALGAAMTARSVRGIRDIPAEDFLLGFMTTALEPDEILTEVRIPYLPEAARFGFCEFSRRAGDFAQAMALVSYDLREGLIISSKVAVGAVEAGPRRIGEVEALLDGRVPSSAIFMEAAEAASIAVDPIEDDEIGVRYKRDLVRAAVLRALRDSVDPQASAIKRAA